MSDDLPLKDAVEAEAQKSSALNIFGHSPFDERGPLPWEGMDQNLEDTMFHAFMASGFRAFMLQCVHACIHVFMLSCFL